MTISKAEFIKKNESTIQEVFEGIKQKFELKLTEHGYVSIEIPIKPSFADGIIIEAEHRLHNYLTELGWQLNSSYSEKTLKLEIR
ncbi:hypothetical protein VV869_12855 [Photobacterium sp. MCCC 1A19761]|uniref:hypothetical protein n=1 Tax=Photobacterium sp. MCCC 1A19761 TaxID=3115000 RepID=UPI00307D3A35